MIGANQASTRMTLTSINGHQYVANDLGVYFGSTEEARGAYMLDYDDRMRRRWARPFPTPFTRKADLSFFDNQYSVADRPARRAADGRRNFAGSHNRTFYFYPIRCTRCPTVRCP